MPREMSPVSRAVAVEVLVHGPRSRSQLARTMGLSPATLTRVVRPLLEDGVLVETDAVRGPGRGRSSLPLDVVAGRRLFVGVKLTATAVHAVLTGLRAEPLASEVVPVASADVPDVLDAVTGVVTSLVAGAGRAVDAVGVTVGGRVDEHGVVADSSFLGWSDVPLRRLLSGRLGTPVHVANDVVGLTMAQQWFGDGRTHPDFALLTVGAGVGYGLVVADRLVPTQALPVSHLPVDPHGPLCPLGHRGCLTAYVTSDAMTAAVAQGRGGPVSYGEVLELAEGGDPLAVRVVDEAARALGRAVATVTTLTGVERVVLSGEGVRLAEVGRRSLEAGRTEHAVPGSGGSEPVVRPMDFLEWARGAAAVAVRASFP